MSYWGDFTAREEHGTENVQYSDEGVSASVQLRVAYADVDDIVSDLLSNRREWPKDVPGLVPLARNCGIIPVPGQYTTDAGEESCVYEEALITVQYATTELAQPTVDSIEPTAEFITLDYRCFRWGAPDGVPLQPEEAPGLLLRGFNFVRTFTDRVDQPHTDYIEKVGAVNDDTVSSTTLGFDFPAETLLYQPPNLSWSPRIDGTTRFNLTIKGTYKPQGWNKYWHALTQQWLELYLVGDASPYKSYPPEDLSNVWNYSPLP